MKRVLAFILCAFMLISAVACGGGKDTPDTSAQAPISTQAPADNTTAAPPADNTTVPPENTTAPASDVTTDNPADTSSGEPEYGENEFGKLEGEQLTALKDLLPALLPDNTVIEDFVRPLCMDETFDAEGFGNHYMISGNSSPQAKFVDTEHGALFGLGLNISARGKDANNRAEVEVKPYEDFTPKGAKGVLFWVDFSNTEIQTDTSKKYQYCASVTFNVNKYRSNISESGSKGYFLENDNWVETKNINACRMELPNQYKGWVYVPATSYIDTGNSSPITDADGRFTDFDVITSMRFYTDGYVYSDSEDKFVIFDEILFIY